jgi:hypothetical protein
VFLSIAALWIDPSANAWSARTYQLVDGETVPLGESNLKHGPGYLDRPPF